MGARVDASSAEGLTSLIASDLTGVDFSATPTSYTESAIRPTMVLAAKFICDFRFDRCARGPSEPSDADERITRRLKAALELVDIRLLDHLVVGHGEVTSLASRGLL